MNANPPTVLKDSNEPASSATDVISSSDSSSNSSATVVNSEVDEDDSEGSNSSDSTSSAVSDGSGPEDNNDDAKSGKRKCKSSSAQQINNKRNRTFTVEDKRNLVRKFLANTDFLPVINGVVKGRQLDENGIAAFLHKENKPEVQHSMLTKWIVQYKLGCFEDFPDYSSVNRRNCSKEKVLK